jgi:hypothetical protein
MKITPIQKQSAFIREICGLTRADEIFYGFRANDFL